MRVVSSAVALAMCCVLSGCSAPKVDVGDFVSNPAQSAACATYVAALPGSLLDVGRRPVTGTHSVVTSMAAAWGDPAIVLRCGVGADYATGFDADQIKVNGTSWRHRALSNGDEFVSTDAAIRIAIAVPRSYASPVDVLVDIDPRR